MVIVYYHNTRRWVTVKPVWGIFESITLMCNECVWMVPGTFDYNGDAL